MREELKNTDWHTYGLSISDYDYTKRLINELIEDRNKQIVIKGVTKQNREGIKWSIQKM